MIAIKQVYTTDNVTQLIDKLNFNFNQVLQNGGGVQGIKGEQGSRGEQGDVGKGGEKWFLGGTDPNTFFTLFPDTTLQDGDLFLFSDKSFNSLTPSTNGDVYKLVNGLWKKVANINYVPDVVNSLPISSPFLYDVNYRQVNIQPSLKYFDTNNIYTPFVLGERFDDLNVANNGDVLFSISSPLLVLNINHYEIPNDVSAPLDWNRYPYERIPNEIKFVINTIGLDNPNSINKWSQSPSIKFEKYTQDIIGNENISSYSSLKISNFFEVPLTNVIANGSPLTINQIPSLLKFESSNISSNFNNIYSLIGSDGGDIIFKTFSNTIKGKIELSLYDSNISSNDIRNSIILDKNKILFQLNSFNNYNPFIAFGNNANTNGYVNLQLQSNDLVFFNPLRPNNYLKFNYNADVVISNYVSISRYLKIDSIADKESGIIIERESSNTKLSGINFISNALNWYVGYTNENNNHFLISKNNTNTLPNIRINDVSNLISLYNNVNISNNLNIENDLFVNNNANVLNLIANQTLLSKGVSTFENMLVLKGVSDSSKVVEIRYDKIVANDGTLTFNFQHNKGNVAFNFNNGTPFRISNNGSEFLISNLENVEFKKTASFFSISGDVARSFSVYTNTSDIVGSVEKLNIKSNSSNYNLVYSNRLDNVLSRLTSFPTGSSSITPVNSTMNELNIYNGRIIGTQIIGDNLYGNLDWSYIQNKPILSQTFVYADITQRNIDINVWQGKRCVVDNAVLDNRIESGRAFYIYKGGGWELEFADNMKWLPFSLNSFGNNTFQILQPLFYRISNNNLELRGEIRTKTNYTIPSSSANILIGNISALGYYKMLYGIYGIDVNPSSYHQELVQMRLFLYTTGDIGISNTTLNNIVLHNTGRTTNITFSGNVISK